MTNTKELHEGEREWKKFYAGMASQQLSRRTVLRAGAAASLLATGGMSALVAACSGGGSGSSGQPAATGTAAASGSTPAPAGTGITGDWDTTKTAPYKQGLSDAASKVPAEWKQYPWVYKYGPWRYNWDVPVTRGGRIIVGAVNNVAADYDLMVRGTGAQPMYSKLFNAGLREGSDLITASIEPELAIGSEHNADYTSWVFKLPPKVAFHNLPPVNGRLLTAADVVFSFQRHMDSSLQKAALRYVDKVTAVDGNTVRFDLKQPLLSLPGTLSNSNFSVFAPEAYADQPTFKKSPVGTGPFSLKFSEYQNRADFVRHPQYWRQMPVKLDKYGSDPLPLVDTYTRQSFANVLTAKEAWMNGEIDTFQPGCGLDTALVREQLQRVPDAIVNTNAYWSCCPMLIGFNYKNPLFQDIRVRQALSLSVNREQIWNQGMDKTGVVNAGPVPFDFMGYTIPPALKEYGPNAQFDPQKAKQLMAAAGHTSLPLKLQVYQTPNQPAAWQGAYDTAVFNWKQAGIVDAQQVMREAVLFTQDMINKTFPDMFMALGLTSGYTLDSLVSPPLRTGSAANYGSLSDPELDKLLDSWAVAVDPAVGVRLAREMTKRIVDNVDHIWIGSISGLEMNRAWLHGMVMSVHNCYNGIGLGNYQYAWIDQTAPAGRGGKPVVKKT